VEVSLEKKPTAGNDDKVGIRPLRIVFAPDYRAGITYQADLANALVHENVSTLFLSHYRRGLPLYRGCADFAPFDGLHLHWPEAYFRESSRWWKARFVFDLFAATWKRPLFLTAHNLYPHNRGDEPWMRKTLRRAVGRAAAIFVHSEKARDLYANEFGADPAKCHLVSFGDHAEAVGTPIPRDQARRQLNLPLNEPICIMFGTVSPYKGQEEVIAAWQATAMPARLVIVGPATRPEYAETLAKLCAGSPNILLRTGDWLTPADLQLWLSAADATIFNYRDILTSGAACLARSFGLPILFPTRLGAVDIGEPHPSVLRYKSLTDDGPHLLGQAISRGVNYEDAATWRAQTRWECVAAATARVYRNVIGA
jgi:beta-1,4-mannosyltransferase